MIENNIENIVVGYNKEWKDSIKLGNKVNQTFVQIQYLKLVNYLKKVVGDSYVSKIINSGRLFLPIKFDNLYDLKTL